MQKYQQMVAKMVEENKDTRLIQFSKNLSEKFWTEVKKLFPKIDFVGVKI